MATGAAFGGGGDPLGLVNRGVEGSGAAQIFQDSSAVNDFVQGQKVREATQAKAEEKKKAEKDKLFNQALEFDYEAWQQADGKILANEYANVISKAAELQANGIDPKTNKEWVNMKNLFSVRAQTSKEQLAQYTAYVNKIREMGALKTIPEEDLANYQKEAQAFFDAGIDGRKPLNLNAIDKYTDPLVGLKRFKDIYVQKKKDYVPLGNGQFEIVEDYDIEDIRKNFESVKNEPWMKALTEQNPNFKEDFLGALQTSKNIKGTQDKEQVSWNKKEGTWGNKSYEGRVIKTTLGDMFDAAQFGGMGNEAVTELGLDQLGKDWQTKEVKAVDIKHLKDNNYKPLLASVQKMKGRTIDGVEVDISRFPKGTVKFMPNIISETGRQGNYLAQGLARVTVNEPNSLLPKTIEFQLAFPINASNKQDFENQWLPQGQTIEQILQTNGGFEGGSSYQGTNKSESTKATNTKPASKKVSLSTIKSKVGTTGFEGYSEKELVDYYKSQGYTIE